MSLVDEYKVRLILLNVVLLIPTVAVLAIQPTGPGYITDIDDIFSVHIDEVPEIDIDEWKLSITGNISNPVNFTIDELLDLPPISQEVELQCVDGYFAYAEWTGVALSEIIEIVNISSDVLDVVFFAADGYDSSLSLDLIDPAEIILAYGVNNETLLPEIGYPLRVVVPGQYGYKWVMWVTEIRFVSYNHIGYWESRGWSDNAQYEQAEQILYPLNWRVHALLLSLAFYIGSLILTSGLRDPLAKKYLLNLPTWMGKKFHQILGMVYSILTLGSTGLWIGRSIILKGSLDWEFHGVLAVISVSALGLLIIERLMSLCLTHGWNEDLTQSSRYMHNFKNSQTNSKIPLILHWFHIIAGIISLGSLFLPFCLDFAIFRSFLHFIS
ncbi:MAG: molybdopterin-dependent oxidoreductase [Promethearchaeota archaeon]